MLCNCCNFRIFGDGSDKIILIAASSTGTQEAYVLNNPRIESIQINNNMIETTRFGNFRTSYAQGRSTSNINIVGGELEHHMGIDLEKQFSPVWSKSIRELLSIIEKKIDLR